MTGSRAAPGPAPTARRHPAGREHAGSCSPAFVNPDLAGCCCLRQSGRTLPLWRVTLSPFPDPEWLLRLQPTRWGTGSHPPPNTVPSTAIILRLFNAPAFLPADQYALPLPFSASPGTLAPVFRPCPLFSSPWFKSGFLFSLLDDLPANALLTLTSSQHMHPGPHPSSSTSLPCCREGSPSSDSCLTSQPPLWLLSCTESVF